MTGDCHLAHKGEAHSKDNGTPENVLPAHLMWQFVADDLRNKHR
jgi:hypothetical protein